MASNRTVLRLVGVFCAVLFSLGLVANAEAALVSRLNGQAVYDTDFNITWLANANLAASNTFGVSGIAGSGAMDWGTAQSWISAMDSANYLGYSDWRLPTTLQPDATCGSQSSGASFGISCTGSEMGHLFYNELGGTAGTSILTSHNSFLDLFSNVQSDIYWSGTDYALTPGYAWVFGFSAGVQDGAYKSGSFLNAWAVRPGDIAAVPIPAAAWLFGSGLLGLFGLTRRRKIR
ncbi:MAG TPA: DUF1566 domain-containing protein [Candidatus Methylomirabilis sp.]|nr:DUF1566 domain-containing protein [Candidatus Methylomirabilis sp.]